MRLAFRQASAFASMEEGSLHLTCHGSQNPILPTPPQGEHAPPQVHSSPDSSAAFSWERRDGQVGIALRVPVLPWSEHQLLLGSPHVSMREHIASSLKIGHCSDSIRKREQKRWGRRWIEPPFILLMNAFAENSRVTLMRRAAQMVKWAASLFLS